MTFLCLLFCSNFFSRPATSFVFDLLMSAIREEQTTTAAGDAGGSQEVLQ